MDIPKAETKSPLLLSLQYLKSKDVKSSIEILGITDIQAQEIDFINRMMDLEEGLNLFSSGHHSQSVLLLRKSIPLVNITNDEEAKSLVPILADFAEGIAFLLQGNAHDAVKLLRISSNEIKRLNFFIPGMKKVLLTFKAAAEVAVARTHMNIGDMPEVEATFGKVIQIHDELLSILDEKNIEDFPLFNEVFGTRIEISIVFMRFDLEALDFDSLINRVEFTKQNLEKLRNFIEKTPESPIKIALEIVQALYVIFEIYSRIGKNIIIERLPLKKTEMEELLIADKKLFEARQKANNAGDRGKIFLYTINQLKRLNDSFFKIGKVQKNDFGRMSGLIALSALILQVIIFHLTIRPTGNAAISFFLGEIVVSLIAGYGYEALKFKPLLKIYSDSISKKSDDKVNDT